MAGVLAPLVSPASRLELMQVAESPGQRQLWRDEGTIRAVFNGRYPALEVYDPAARAAEINKRESLLCATYRLYGTGRNCTAPEIRRDLQAFEVEALLSTLQRLAGMGWREGSGLIEACEKRQAGDADPLAHVMDPFGLRYLLSHHTQAVDGAIGGEALGPLEAACRRCDRPAIRAWFEGLLARVSPLPAETPQRLRSLLLDLWRVGAGDLGMLAHEIAVVDVILFQELGWENTRLFCAQLRRITGPRSEALDAFLNDEEIDGAVTLAEELGQTELVAHFRRLAATYTTKLHGDVRRSVFQIAVSAQRRSA